MSNCQTKLYFDKYGMCTNGPKNEQHKSVLVV